MSETDKIGPSHLRRPAVVYVRQSSASQVERNTESTARQYGLTSRAAALGWPGGRLGCRSRPAPRQPEPAGASPAPPAAGPG